MPSCSASPRHCYRRWNGRGRPAACSWTRSAWPSLTHLTQTYGGVYFPAERKGTLASWQEKRALEFLSTRLDGRFSIAELAESCELSQSYFIKAFKASFGRTPARWLMEYRIAHAKDLLRTDISIAEIAISCGFADQSHLTKTFSAVTGETPARFRRDNRP
jgi:AraC family transcriptional regulator